MTHPAIHRRQYDHCAKGGHLKPASTGYVCLDHAGTPGWYTHCASCGGAMGEESRDYVCLSCLV